MERPPQAKEQSYTNTSIDVSLHHFRLVVIIDIKSDVHRAPLFFEQLVLRLPLETFSHLIVRCAEQPNPEFLKDLESWMQSDRMNLVVATDCSANSLADTLKYSQSLDATADLVIIGSDFALPDQWLNAMKREVYSGPNIGIVSPLLISDFVSDSNSSTFHYESIFGINLNQVQEFCSGNLLPPTFIDSMNTQCCYIRADCIRDVLSSNDFLSKNSNHESSFSSAAKNSGWQSISTSNVIVSNGGRHTRTVTNSGYSFEDFSDVDKKTKINPLEKLNTTNRRANKLIRALQFASQSARPLILHISHGIGGGVEKHIQELADWLSGYAVCLSMSPVTERNFFRLRFDQLIDEGTVFLDNKNNFLDLFDLLRQLPIQLIHFHHTHNISPIVMRRIQGLGLPIVFTAHDFHMLNQSSHAPKTENQKAIQLQNNQQFLNQCRAILLPSESVRKTFASLLKTNSIIAVRHPDSFQSRNPIETFEKKQNYLIAAIGAINQEKGAELLKQLAVRAKDEEANFRFTIVGYSTVTCDLIGTTGPYSEHQIDGLLESVRPDFFIFAGTAPETYSYTLSIALHSRKPILASNTGAFPERLSERRMTKLFDPTLGVENTLREIRQFIASLEEELKPCVPKFATSTLDPEYYRQQYLKLCSAKIETQTQLPTLTELARKSLKYESSNSANPSDSFFRFAWWIYTESIFAKILARVPLNLKRAIKRKISSKPIHEIVKSTKS